MEISKLLIFTLWVLIAILLFFFKLVSSQEKFNLVSFQEEMATKGILRATKSQVPSNVKNSNMYNNKLQSNCLSSQDMSDLIEALPQVFLLPTAKAAGSSLHAFRKKCAPQTSTLDQPFQQKDMQKMKEDFLLSNFQVPTLLSGHVQAKDLIDTIATVPKNTLLIYSHREESGRLASALKYVIKIRIINPIEKGLSGHMVEWSEQYQTDTQFKLEKNETHYFIPERIVVTLLKQQMIEIAYSDSKQLTCDVYKKVYNYSPNLVIMNYKQVSEIQILLASKHCPEISEQLPLATNQELSTQVVVKSDGGQTEHLLQDWIGAKINVLQWSLDLQVRNECQGDTIKMEEALLSCPTEFIQIVRSN